MSNTDDIRNAIISSLKTIPALSGVDIRPAAGADDMYTVFTRGRGIGVIYHGLTAIDPQMIGTKTRTRCEQTWILAVLASSFQAPTSSHSEAETLVQALRAVRATTIALSDGQQIFLRLRAETLAEPPDRPAQGGPVLYACEYRTSELFI